MQVVDWFQNAAENSKFEPAGWTEARFGGKRSALAAAEQVPYLAPHSIGIENVVLNKLAAAGQGGGLRNQFAEKAEDSEDVELTYLFTPVLFEELIALMVGDVLLAVISFLIVGFYMCATAQSALSI